MSLSLLSRYAFFAGCVIFTLASLPFLHYDWLWPITLVTGLLSLLGLFDLLQSRHAVRRNYPILGISVTWSKVSARRSASTCSNPTAMPCPSLAPSARWCIPGPRTKAPINRSVP